MTSKLQKDDKKKPKQNTAAQNSEFDLCFTHSVAPGPQTEVLRVKVDLVLFLLVFNQYKSSPLPCVSGLRTAALSGGKTCAQSFSQTPTSGGLEAPSFLGFFFMGEGGTNLHRIISNSLKNVRFPSLRRTHPKQGNR